MILERKIPEDFKENGVEKGYDEEFGLICKNIRIQIPNRRFVYFIDSDYVMDTSKGTAYENLTPAYDKILHAGLRQMKYPADEVTNSFCQSYNLVLENLTILADRIIKELEQCDYDTKRQREWFERLKDAPAENFEEAVQRMLFVNQVFWQTDHRLVGLGAWDFHLEDYYRKDILEGRLNQKGVLEILKEVYRILHEHYEYKSSLILGDTGQIFVLGRSDQEGNYIYNDLTYLFIEAMREVQQTEPKCLLRVNRHTPRKLLEIALESIATGIGAPLLANDDVVIPELINFGIDKQDACEYTTSACWEPLIGGKSSGNNNMTVLNYLKALDNLLKRERLDRIDSFEKLKYIYYIYLKRNIRAVKRVLDSRWFQYDPLLSVFMNDCYENKKDVSWGGARYHHIGITSVAMGNLVNSLLNIKEYVFDRKLYTLYDVKKCVLQDFEGNETLWKELKAKASRYGTDDKEVTVLVNEITSCVADELEDYRSCLGGKMKIGLSGAAYMDAARGFGASFDGRKAGDAFTVHISNEDNNGFTEIVNFASQMEYSAARFNGNVIDFMVSPDFIHSNWDKYVDFLMLSIKKGFFEMQMNVVSSKTLIEARRKPEQFPNLIVRVWGFSAYFKDLPEDYKDVLIERALNNES
ncbi:pyruvate formate lyase family protein [Sporofaciens sp. JLR.KK001]|uniref:pyruvate formate lyase family protein n=1 Tax=Sporofaciens sp. JLR.KK001 TaxID=3112621 RepID=UPI002FF1995F